MALLGIFMATRTVPHLSYFTSRLVLIALVVEVLYPVTWQCQSDGWQGGAFVRLYLCGTLTLQAILMLLLAGLAHQSSKGTITDIDARRMVSPFLLIK